jgi:aspartate 1-decarboxylase
MAHASVFFFVERQPESGRSMKRIFLKSKIHRATVTDAALHYEGSVTIDRELLAAADIRPYEQVQIYNITTGSRFVTYALEGEPGSGEICINGAAAHLASAGDLVIIASYAEYDDDEAIRHQPRLVYVDEENQIRLPSATATGREEP